jgi:biopolymer transport protein ExbD
MHTRKRRQGESATPNLTPMIDVTFQLLIFFMLCTRFITPQGGFDAELPRKQGLDPTLAELPDEPLTIYCEWEPGAQAGSYVVAIASRARLAVADSYLAIGDVVPLPSETTGQKHDRKAEYTRVFDALVSGLAQYERQPGNPTSYEISFAQDPARGAAYGTAPWAYVTLAIDAVTKRNKQRAHAGEPALPVNFKFADSRMRFSTPPG